MTIATLVQISSRSLNYRHNVTILQAADDLLLIMLPAAQDEAINDKLKHACTVVLFNKVS